MSSNTSRCASVRPVESSHHKACFLLDRGLFLVDVITESVSHVCLIPTVLLLLDFNKYVLFLIKTFSFNFFQLLVDTLDSSFSI